MKKYLAIFKNHSLIFDSKNFKNNLDVYNFICENKLGLVFGDLVEIKVINK